MVAVPAATKCRCFGTRPSDTANRRTRTRAHTASLSLSLSLMHTHKHMAVGNPSAPWSLWLHLILEHGDAVLLTPAAAGASDIGARIRSIGGPVAREARARRARRQRVVIIPAAAATACGWARGVVDLGIVPLGAFALHDQHSSVRMCGRRWQESEREKEEGGKGCRARDLLAMAHGAAVACALLNAGPGVRHVTTGLTDGRTTYIHACMRAWLACRNVGRCRYECVAAQHLQFVDSHRGAKGGPECVLDLVHRRARAHRRVRVACQPCISQFLLLFCHCKYAACWHRCAALYWIQGHTRPCCYRQ